MPGSTLKHEGNNLQNYPTVHVIIYDKSSPALCMDPAGIVKYKYLSYFTEE